MLLLFLNVCTNRGGMEAIMTLLSSLQFEHLQMVFKSEFQKKKKIEARQDFEVVHTQESFLGVFML